MLFMIFLKPSDASRRSRTASPWSILRQLRWLVQRAIEIISEASRAIPDDLTSTQPDIPWRKIRGIGNVLRHDYEGLSDRILWNVVLDELPRLKAAIQAIAERALPTEDAFASALFADCTTHAQPSRRMTARPITQSLSSSLRNGSSSVKCVMRC